MNQEFRRYVEGERIGGYRITHLIGVGKFGTFYGAEHVMTERKVLIQIPGSENMTPEDLEKLSRLCYQASKLMSKLNHPNISALYDAGEEDGMPYLVVEMFDGQSMYNMLTQGQELPVGVFLRNCICS